MKLTTKEKILNVLYFLCSTEIVLAEPMRKLRVALKYWKPTRLTLKHNVRVHAWLWWNF